MHQRRSIRLKGYDYSQAGLYFITIYCHNNQCLFGNIIVGANRIPPITNHISPMSNCPNDNHPKMVLNEYGQIAFNEWMKTPEIRNNVELGEFVIMPNHIHGVIRLLGRGELHSPNNDELHSSNNVLVNSPNNAMDVFNMSQLNGIMGDSEMMGNHQKKGECDSPLRGPSNNIGAIVRGYKSAVTKQLNLLNTGCAVWQRNYHEHIIRNEQSYQRITEYIINNSAKWLDDKFYSINYPFQSIEKR